MKKEDINKGAHDESQVDKLKKNAKEIPGAKNQVPEKPYSENPPEEEGEIKQEWQELSEEEQKRAEQRKDGYPKN